MASKVATIVRLHYEDGLEWKWNWDRYACLNERSWLNVASRQIMDMDY